MFIGEYQTVIGEKNRVAIPKKLREEIKGKVILTRGYEKCLIMVDIKRWEGLISEINKNPLLSLSVRDTKRYLLSGAIEIEYDTQGRFVISEELKRFGELNSNIVFLGVGEWIEIWDESKWNAKLDVLSNEVSDLGDRLSKSINKSDT